MFSIAAINDTDSRGQWEPLAPTKEAQEFHLTQTYHEGLLKLQSKKYKKAQELLECVLKDPLISSAQAAGKASDGHLLQLRFLALKNLASVFLQQGSGHYESALRCYLQAVEIDTKDSVVWNQLGTLSCSMGLLSISRWAFEQGLLCSPNNWNCMEKLLEVLIAIRDEIACLSVADLILRHWPSHSRALNVKNAIEETETLPFAPRGIDKLEPKHVRLKFIDKRKATDESLDEGAACKKLNQNLELCLAETSWAALADALLEILLPLNGSGVEFEKALKSGDVRLTIRLPSSSDIDMGLREKKGIRSSEIGEIMPAGESNSGRSIVKPKETNVLEEQPLERRSTRLERLRSRKPGKEEEEDFANEKDLPKNVLQFLESFIIGRPGNKDCNLSAICLLSCPGHANSLNTESSDVTTFVRETSVNHGAYHMGHLLLEHAASRSLKCHDAFVKFLELEKLTRCSGLDRTPECSLYLSELYYDLGSSPSNVHNQDLMLEASYHLCKIIESVSLDYPFDFNSVRLDSSFWIRYFWLNGRLSILDGDKAKAHEQFCISLNLFEKKENMNDPSCVICLPHCKTVKELTIGRILHEINLLEIDFLLEKTLDELIEKEMYSECVTLLAPLLFSTTDVHLDLLPLPAADKRGEGVKSVELVALDILMKACEKTKPMDTEMYLSCQRRKLQILMVLCGMDDSLASSKTFFQKSGLKMHSASNIVSIENSSNHGYHLVAEEIKAILQCISQVKNSFDQSGDYNVCNVLVSSICGIQCLMLVVMCNVATSFLSKKFSGPINVDQTDQKLQCCFVDAAIAFCKLQHLNPTVPVKTQVDLIAAIHDLLAEYGLCCAGEGDGGEDGIFLKFAIKHLLALNMKLKSDFSTANKDKTEHDKLLSHGSHFKTSEKELRSGGMDAEMVGAERYETVGGRKDASGGSPNGIPSHSSLEKENPRAGSYIHCDGNRGEKNSNPLTEEFSEDEREELELMIDNALDQCFYCLYGLNLRSDSSYEDDLVMHRNTSRGDYQTKEQSTDVFQYVLPYAKDSSRTGLVKLRRVLRAIRKHFPQPPEGVLAGNAIDKFLDDLALCEDKLSEDAGSDGYLGTMMKIIFPDGCIKKFNAPSSGSSDPYLEVYRDLYYYLAQAEEMSTTDKWPGFVLTKEGEEFVQQNANLFKFDLLYNPLRFESWQRLANIYDEEVDLLLNDGSKHINVAGWRKNVTLPQRVETSRRRSRRCLLMSLALAKTSEQQCETHELLALVYYDSLQNVVPFYDQRSVVPSKDAAWKTFCEMSLKHFKQAFSHKEDWTHAFYMGKLCQKLGYSYETSLSYYEKAICLNLSAVDALYRMHASRLKLLWTCGKQNVEILTVLSTYSYSQSTKDDVMNIIGKMDPEVSHLSGTKDKISVQVDEVWNLLYNDCLSALEVCVEGDLKHFHKARYMLSQGLYKRGEVGDLEKAKDELSFCFKSSRSSFTINMWEIDGMVKKGRRKTAGFAGNKKVLEVNLPESSRKFITCIRKYLLFYLKLLEETGDVCTLERAYVSLRADKRFSLCIEDLVPVALGRYIRALLSSMHHADTTSSGARSSSEHQLEKIFGLFVEQGNLWPEICGAPEIKSPEISESSLYGYLHEYIVALESKGKLETLEAINEKIRKRFKNPKLSNNNGAKVCRHASVAWCRSLIIKLASITPLLSLPLSAIQEPNQSDGVLENSQLLCVDLTTNEFWNSSFEDRIHLKSLEKKWNPMLSKIKNVIIKKTADENLDTAHAMLRNSYNFYRESTSVALPSGVNLFFVSSRLASEAQFQPGMDGVEILDLSVPRKLLLWAYTLLQGRSASISAVVKHCEENIKSKMKKGFGASPVLTNTSSQTAATTNTGGAKDGVGHIGGTEAEAARHTAALPASQTQTTGEIASVTVTPTSLTQSSASVSPNENAKFVLALPSSAESQRSLSRAPPLHESGDTAAERSPTAHGGDNQDGG